MSTIFYTICDKALQRGLPNSRNLDFNGFMNSFRRFHPDIEMIVFNEGDMQLRGVNYYNAKATFGKILSETYDLVINVDADHYFFDRCDEILAADYDVACPINFNVTDNLVAINVKSGINGGAKEQALISVQDFLQGGLIASPNKSFWQHYEFAVKKYWDKFHCFENDVLNLVAYLYPYNVKVLDKNCFYGCSIIAKEQKCYVENNKIMCEGKPVKAYHFAHGSAKRGYADIFNAEVAEFIKNNIIC